jgi:hypothetical protein
MVAWKLSSLLLVTFGLSGLAAVAIFTPRERLVGPCVHFVFWHPGQPVDRIIYSCAPSQDIPLQLLRAFRPIVFNPDVRWLAWSATAAAGLILLAGYRLACRRQWRRGRRPGPMLAGSFPLLAAGFFGAIAVAFAMLDASSLEITVTGAPAIRGAYPRFAHTACSRHTPAPDRRHDLSPTSSTRASCESRMSALREMKLGFQHLPGWWKPSFITMPGFAGKARLAIIWA